jgi:hypothetical protein
VLAKLIVPVVVIAPPVKPVPVATDETVPLQGVAHCSPEAEAELAVKTCPLAPTTKAVGAPLAVAPTMLPFAVSKEQGMAAAAKL